MKVRSSGGQLTARHSFSAEITQREATTTNINERLSKMPESTTHLYCHDVFSLGYHRMDVS